MKLSASVFGLAILFGGALASADPVFYNATQGTFRVEGTLPSGQVKAADLHDNAAGLSQAPFLLAAGVAGIKVAIIDDMGSTAWKGAINADDTYLVVPDGKGIKAVYAGVHGSPESPAVVLFMNITGDALTIDLEGHNGVGANRGVVPPTMFDPKAAVRLDPREATFDVLGKTKSGEKIEIEGKVTPGRYCVIWKDGRNAVHATTLGKFVPKR